MNRNKTYESIRKKWEENAQNKSKNLKESMQNKGKRITKRRKVDLGLAQIKITSIFVIFVWMEY